MNLITVRSVPWDDDDAVALRKAMLVELYDRYADRITSGELKWADGVTDESVAYTGVADLDGQAVEHIALRRLGPDLEIKRMYVAPESRGTGVAMALLAAVERTAASLGAQRLVLQTGDRQPDAVRLYEKAGYTPIPVFPPYVEITVSQCFAKAVSPVQAAPGGHDTGVEAGEV